MALKSLLTSIFVGGLAVGFLMPTLVPSVSALMAQPQEYPIEERIAEPILQRDSVADQILDLQASLRGQLLEYREAESAYTIAREEMIQLGTLAASEKAVLATKEVLRLRNQVLTTYVNLLRLSLLESTSVSLPVKERTLNSLEVVLTDLQRNQGGLEQAVTRQDLQVVANDFAVLSPRLVQEAGLGRAALRAARLRQAFTVTSSLLTDLEARNATASASLRQSERNRAFDQTRQVLGDTEVRLQTLESNLTTIEVDQDITRSLEDLFAEIYAGNSQALSYIKEIYQSFFQD